MSAATEGFSAMINCFPMRYASVVRAKERTIISTNNSRSKFSRQQAVEELARQALIEAAGQDRNVAVQLELREQRGSLGGGEIAARGKRAEIAGVVA